MTNHLRFGVHCAVIESDLVICDMVRDAFLLLPAAIAPPGTTARSLGALRLCPDALAALRQAGLLTSRPAPARPLPPPPLRQTDVTALDLAPSGVSVRQVLAFAAAGIEAAIRLAFSSFNSRIRPRPVAASHRLTEEIAVLRTMLFLCPGVRRCLPRALMTRAYLNWRGIDVNLVLGVRTHPFDAHCWLQSDDLLVDDRLDHIRGYTPVAVL